MDITARLPVDCITHIISLTSPRDACRSSLVSPTFRSAADADPVWERFLPSDYHEIISQSSSPTLDHSLSKKDLYFHLCHHPIFISNGTMVREEKTNFTYFIQNYEGYSFYYLFHLVTYNHRFAFEATISVELRVNFEGREGGGVRSVFLGAPSNMPQLSGSSSNMPQLSQDRGDGWMEVEMGEFFNENGDDGTVVCCLWNVSNYSAKQGLIVEAIEVRPK